MTHARPFRVRLWVRLRIAGRTIWRALVHLLEDDGTTVAGHIAFTSLFSLFPFLIFLTTVAAQFGQDEAADHFVHIVLRTLPPEVAEAIQPAMEQFITTPQTGLMTLSIAVSLWVASSGIEALRTALNMAYGVERPRSIWFRRLQSFGLTILATVSIIPIMLALVVGPVVWAYVSHLVEVPDFWRWLYNVLRYLVAVVLLFFVIVLLYRWLPNRRMRWREVLPGAAATVILWFGTASLFSLYLQNLGRFSITYGSLGGIVITLMFFYLSALIFIFGAEINSARRREAAANIRRQRTKRAERDGTTAS
ncbi:MAG: YihY/virulence factor BrkB family protein [Pseudomonadota bacterium]